MKLKSIILILLISNALTMLLLYKEHKKHPSVNPTAYNQPYFHDRDKLFYLYPKDTEAIIFLGDSEINDFDWSEYFGEHVKNRGIRGDNSKGILNRLNEIIGEHPDKIFLQIGINDISNGISKDTLLQHEKEIIQRIKTELPETEVFVISLFPVADSSSLFPAACNPKNNQVIRQVNDSLKAFAMASGSAYIDAYSALVTDKHINPSYSINDGLHLNKLGYEVLIRSVSPYVK